MTGHRRRDPKLCAPSPSAPVGPWTQNKTEQGEETDGQHGHGWRSLLVLCVRRGVTAPARLFLMVTELGLQASPAHGSLTPILPRSRQLHQLRICGPGAYGCQMVSFILGHFTKVKGLVQREGERLWCLGQQTVA